MPATEIIMTYLQVLQFNMGSGCGRNCKCRRTSKKLSGRKLLATEKEQAFFQKAATKLVNIAEEQKNLGKDAWQLQHFNPTPHINTMHKSYRDVYVESIHGLQ